jgi:hypothetical protein
MKSVLRPGFQVVFSALIGEDFIMTRYKLARLTVLVVLPLLLGQSCVPTAFNGTTEANGTSEGINGSAGATGPEGPKGDAGDINANKAADSSPSIEVTKTAFVDGQNVCGAIRIKNTDGQAAVVIGVADSLEVHFPSSATPPPLPAGSSANWFKVADVPIPLPAPIAPGKTTTVNYCFSLCLAADAPGANSMRNVVAVTVADSGGRVTTVTTRSAGFAPPVLNCQACCLSDGSCTDTQPNDCVAAHGVPKGVGTDCATTECSVACCHSNGPCVDEGPSACQTHGGTSQGMGTTCATNGCPVA